MISEVGLYQLTTPFLGFVTLVVLAWTFRLSARIRSFGLAATAFCAIMTLGYALMANGILTRSFDGETTAFGRFVGYLVAFVIIYAVVWSIADGSVPVFVALLFAHVTWITSTIVSWAGEGSLALAGTLGIFLAFLLTLFLLLGPLSRQAASVSGERRLLYGKLRNLIVLILILYMVNGILTDSGAGLLDTFVGVFIGIYSDVILVVGFSAILLRSRTALAQMTPGGGEAEDADVTFEEPTAGLAE